MRTPVYVKMDAKDQLLLHVSEGLCRKLGILSYHKEGGEVKKRTEAAG